MFIVKQSIQPPRIPFAEWLEHFKFELAPKFKRGRVELKLPKRVAFTKRISARATREFYVDDPDDIDEKIQEKWRVDKRDLELRPTFETIPLLRKFNRTGIQIDHIPHGFLKDIPFNVYRSNSMINLTNGLSHPMHVLGIAQLFGTLGSYSPWTPFVVVRKLGADMLLGCKFIDQHINGTFPDKPLVRSPTDERVPVTRRRMTKQIRQELGEPKLVGKHSQNNFNGFGCARASR